MGTRGAIEGKGPDRGWDENRRLQGRGVLCLDPSRGRGVGKMWSEANAKQLSLCITRNV